jgi:hypothetical protein
MMSLIVLKEQNTYSTTLTTLDFRPAIFFTISHVHLRNVFSSAPPIMRHKTLSVAYTFKKIKPHSRCKKLAPLGRSDEIIDHKMEDTSGDVPK